MGQTLKTFGHQVERFVDLTQLVASAKLDPPDVIIVDLDALDDSTAAFQSLSNLQCPQAQPIPLFVLSSHDEFNHYLQAVRAGVIGYFVKPLNPATLEARLQRLLSVRERDAFRVLIVDDDMLLAQHYALVLQNAGLRAENPDRSGRNFSGPATLSSGCDPAGRQYAGMFRPRTGADGQVAG